ncbi:mevalonate kinase-like [Pogonomyrmex barbatus]|uniref:Mevalonate kinase-like n=1 Tax=Pogonomyrmex barbatus TaxID=144034 RepID=A0A6I9WBH5_9HYME|nr:mevalonate kinase-like [Pogonomyrmex barbatus]
MPLNPFICHFFNDNITETIILKHDLYIKVKDYVSSLTDYIGTYEPMNDQHKLSLQAFFFLLVYIAYRYTIKIMASFIINISSELPIGKGMGSSTSFAACLATCFWRWSLLQKGIVRYEFGEEDMKVLKRCITMCEKVVYNSSNISDSIVPIFGALLVFEKNGLQKIYEKFPSIKVLIMYSNITSEAVQKHSYPFADSILDSIDAISKESIEIFNQIEEEPGMNLYKYSTSTLSDSSQSNYEKLSDLIRMNQGLLNALGISHSNVDTICAIAQDYSLSGKMACRGRLDYTYILLPQNITDEDLIKLLDKFKSRNFFGIVTSLCGDWSGVRVE